MATDVILQNLSLANDFGCDGIKRVATDAVGCPLMGEDPVASFGRHERTRTICYQRECLTRAKMTKVEKNNFGHFSHFKL